MDMTGWMGRAVCLILAAVLLIGTAYSEEKDLAVFEGLDPSWKNILLLGTDQRPGEETGRTDTMIILSVNPEEKAVRLTSLMRDVWVDIYGTNRSHKINAANVFGGPDAAMATVNHYFDLNIERYVLVDMEGLTGMIDKLDGVDVPLTAEEAACINAEAADQAAVGGGERVHLTGEQAVAYARIRSIGGDQQRTERQRTVLMAMAEKLKETSVLGLMNVAVSMLSNAETNLSLNELIDLCRCALDIEVEKVEQLRIPQDGAYSMGSEEKSGLSVIWADFERNTEILHEFIYGE